MKRIITYNLNGIRAALNKGLSNWIEQMNADVVCFQEIKADLSVIPTEIFEHLGYHHYWFPAQKKGYSGVGILCKEKPKNIVFGCGTELYDFEGRVLRVDFDNYSVLSIYHPSGSSGDLRQAFKMEWLKYFLEYVNNLKKEIPNLILCGDYNICHKPMDIHDPVGNKNSSGFLPEERAWFDTFVASDFVDSFREKNTNPHHYTWWSYRAGARGNNKGWRIDYIMLTPDLKDKLIDAVIVPDAMHSDHCPMYIDIEL